MIVGLVNICGFGVCLWFWRLCVGLVNMCGLGEWFGFGE